MAADMGCTVGDCNGSIPSPPGMAGVVARLPADFKMPTADETRGLMIGRSEDSSASIIRALASPAVAVTLTLRRGGAFLEVRVEVEADATDDLAEMPLFRLMNFLGSIIGCSFVKRLIGGKKVGSLSDSPISCISSKYSSGSIMWVDPIYTSRSIISET